MSDSIISLQIGQGRPLYTAIDGVLQNFGRIQFRVVHEIQKWNKTPTTSLVHQEHFIKFYQLLSNEKDNNLVKVFIKKVCR